MVYFVTVLWQSLKDEDWDQWKYALKELGEHYDDQIEPPDRRGKISKALAAWEELYQNYPCEGRNTNLNRNRDFAESGLSRHPGGRVVHGLRKRKKAVQENGLHYLLSI